MYRSRITKRISVNRPVAWEAIKLGREEHAFVVGMTGMGKTELVRHLLEDPDKLRSVVYDAKHSRNINDWTDSGHVIIEQFEDLDECEGQGIRRIIYRPSFEESNNPEMQDAFFNWVFQRGYTRVFLDECNALLAKTKPCMGLLKCLSMGRENGISVICASQRSHQIPVIVYSEASKIYAFHQNFEEDRRRISSMTGFTDHQLMDLRKFEFLFHDLSRRGRFNRRIKLDLKGIRPRQANHLRLVRSAA